MAKKLEKKKPAKTATKTKSKTDTKKVSAAVKGIAKNATEVVEKENPLKMITPDMTAAQKLEVYQNNIPLLSEHKDFLIGSTLMDDADSKIVLNVSKIILADLKLVAMGSKVNELINEIEAVKSSETKTEAKSATELQ